MTDYDKSILPGGEGRIRASLDTTHYSGPVSKTVAVITDDPAKAAFTLTLKADVFTFVEISPSTGISMRVQGGEEVAQTITLTPRGVHELMVKSVTLEHAALRYSLTPPPGTPVGEGQSYALTLRAPRNLPTGVLSGSLTLSTNIAEQPTITIPYTVTLTPAIPSVPPATVTATTAIQIVPPTISIRVSARPTRFVTSADTIYYAEPSEAAEPLGVRGPGETYPIWQYQAPWAQVELPDKRVVWVNVSSLEKLYSGTSAPVLVRHSQAKPFTILEARSDVPGVEVEISSRQPGQYLLSCRYESREIRRSVEGRVLLRTDQEKAREVSCPLSISPDAGRP